MAAKKNTTKRRKKATTKKPARKDTAKKKATKKPKTASRKKAAAKAPKATLSVGTTIERTFKGETYRLRVTEDGYAIGKDTYRSLTAAAKAVTKYPSVSGPRFWGTDAATQNGGAK